MQVVRLWNGSTEGHDAHVDWRESLDRAVVERVVTESRTTRLELMRLPDGSRCARKSWVFPSRRDRLRGAFRTTIAARSPAAREFDALVRLRALGEPDLAPEPWLASEERRAGVLHACTLTLRWLEDVAALDQFLLAPTEPAVLRRALGTVAVATARMHEAGLLDRDHHPRNVLVSPDGGRVWFIDSPKQRAGTRVERRRAALDLAALDVGLSRLVSRSERLRAIRRYLDARGIAEDRAGRWVDAVAALRIALEPRELRRLELPTA